MFYYIGVHFDTSSESLVKEITTAIRVFAYGVEDFVNDPANANETLTTQLSCEGDGESRWITGEKFYKLVCSRDYNVFTRSRFNVWKKKKMLILQ